MSGGFGNIPWGGAWGSEGQPVNPAHIPVTPMWAGFDLSGTSPANEVESILTYEEVSVSGDGASFFIASFNVASGGPYPALTAVLMVNVAVDATFTVQYDVTLKDLPEDFTGIGVGVAAANHVYLGAWSSQDYAVGFFISKVGWAYTGEVSLDGSGNVVPAQAVNIIPGSEDWTQEGGEYVIRVIVDAGTQLTSVYIQDVAAGGGFQLKALLVAIRTSTIVTDNVFLSVRGDALHTSWLELFTYQLSYLALYPFLAPVANAGPDKAILACSILQLDGGASIDPEGFALFYEWRLVDAPDSSVFCVPCADGQTLAETPPTGFAYSFYSQELEEADAIEPVQINDVLTYSAGSFTIKQVVRTPVFHVVVEYEQLPQNQSNIPFRVLRQTGISGASTQKPTFYPDVTGFYYFDLRVSDVESSSSPLGVDRSRVLVNVLESPLPRGCEVDASFIFDYLLSFWKQVEDRDRIATFWEAMARVASSELLTIWQIEYSKSLRDIQKTFIRRWLHYDLLLPEPSPELTTLRFLWGGFTSEAIPGMVSGVGGTFFTISSPFLSNTVSLPLLASGDVTPEAYAQQLQVRLREVLGTSVAGSVWRTRAGVTTQSLLSVPFPTSAEGRTLTVVVDGGSAQTAVLDASVTSLDLFVQALSAQLSAGALVLNPDGSLRVGSPTVGGVSSVTVSPLSTLLSSNGGPLTFDALADSSVAYVHIDANVPFTVMSVSTAPAFTYPKFNSLIGSASGGEAVGIRTFRASYSLVNTAIKEDDLLVLGRTTYRIARIIDDARDPFAFQRVVVKEDLSATSLGTLDWVIPGWVESSFLNFWAGLVDRGDVVDFEVLTTQNGTFSIATTAALGVNENIVGRLAIDTSTLALQLSLAAGTLVYLARVLRRHYVPVDTRIVDVPILTDVIEVVDTDAILRRNVDYYIEPFRSQNALRFCAGVGSELGDVWEGDRPPPRLWAEYSYVDNSDRVESNFGAAINVTRDKIPASVDYLSAVRGLWYAYYNGPTMADIRIAIQIFLGLPFAEEAGTILEIRTNYLTQTSRMLVQDVTNGEIVRSYTYPRVLSVETNPDTGAPYVVGDSVSQFAPLVTGAEVLDWIKDPTWFQGIVNQGIFYEVQKYHTFLVRVNSLAFNLASLQAAQSFITTIKPVYTQPLYVVQLEVGPDEIDVVDTVTFSLKLSFFDTPCDRMGASYFFDEPWAAGSEATPEQEWRNHFDQDDNPFNALPVYPGPSDPVAWGADKEWLCPNDVLTVDRCEVYAPGALPRMDSVFAFDQQITQQEIATPTVPGVYPATLAMFASSDTGTITRFSVQLNGPTAGTGLSEPHWQAVLQLNGTSVAALSFDIGCVHPVLGFVVTMPMNIELISSTLSVPVTAGDVLTLVIGPTTASSQTPGWIQILVAVSFGLGPWAVDVPLAGGSYCSIGEVL